MPLDFDPYSLRIGGITPFSTVDWPGKIAAVCFLAGCPYRCAYCQNSGLWEMPASGAAAAAAGGSASDHGSPAADTFDDLLRLLDTRRGLLDGMVFSGGEPLAQPAVVAAARAVREQGFLVGLHTSGAYPERLAAMAGDLAWVGLDMKAPWEGWDRITRGRGSGEKARESLRIVQEAGIDYECRTTWHPDLLTPQDLVAIARQLAEAGVERWAVQAYRSLGVSPDAGLRDLMPTPDDVPPEACAAVAHYEFREG